MVRSDHAYDHATQDIIICMSVLATSAKTWSQLARSSLITTQVMAVLGCPV